MTKDEKDLLLKDLCSRLPYGVVIQDKCLVHDDSFLPNKEDDTLIDIDVYSGILMTNGGSFYEVDEMKPYLFPLSSMTEEQEKELEEIDPEFYSVIRENGNICISMDVRGYDWLNKNNFDYRGLIPMDLAIDATNLNIY